MSRLEEVFFVLSEVLAVPDSTSDDGSRRQCCGIKMALPRSHHHMLLLLHLHLWHTQSHLEPWHNAGNGSHVQAMSSAAPHPKMLRCHG